MAGGAHVDQIYFTADEVVQLGRRVVLDRLHLVLLGFARLALLDLLGFLNQLLFFGLLGQLLLA